MLIFLPHFSQSEYIYYFLINLLFVLLYTYMLVY